MQPGKIFRKDLLSFMPKFEDNQSVISMNPNLVYHSLMYILCAMYFSGHLELIDLFIHITSDSMCGEHTFSRFNF